MTSKYPIIDPLYRLNNEAVTQEERTRNRGSQVALGFLITCKDYQRKGTLFFWRNNHFVFTSEQALRNLAKLSPELRHCINTVTFRIIARYYDDKKRAYLAPYPAWEPSKQKRLIRLDTTSLTNTGFGFRSYSWNLTMVFLEALVATNLSESFRARGNHRLLPALDCLRMDFVNFPRNYLRPPSDSWLHEGLVTKRLGCTLNELFLTGLPQCAFGNALAQHLLKMVKDDGLSIKADATFVHFAHQLHRVRHRTLQSITCFTTVRETASLEAPTLRSP
ncbi:hypothetical protein VTI74DRAFT_2474 [Chaetomium olivicolor]